MILSLLVSYVLSGQEPVSFEDIRNRLADHVIRAFQFEDTVTGKPNMQDSEIDLRMITLDETVAQLRDTFSRAGWSFSRMDGWEGSVATWTSNDSWECRVSNVHFGPGPAVRIYWTSPVGGLGALHHQRT